MAMDSADGEEYKLELLQVLFRHGDRVSTKSEMYEADPYNSLYQEMGSGSLTKVGMRRAYKLGEVLRQRYNDFLGEYRSKEVYGRSTYMDRTKMSLQLVLAGLYPPIEKTRWSNEIHWSPIPTHYKTKEKDYFTSFIRRPRYQQLHEEYLENRIKSLDVEESFVDHVRNSTGVGLLKVHEIYLNIRNVLSLGLPLPSWCSDDDYKKLEKFGEVFFDALGGTPEIEKIAAGHILKTFLSNIEAHEAGVEAKKVYLYAAHDLNVAPFLSMHNFTEMPKIVDYGCAVVMEKLKARDNQVYLRMSLWTGAYSEEWIPLTMKNCNRECLLSDYKKLMEHSLPDDELSSEISPTSVGEN